MNIDPHPKNASSSPSSLPGSAPAHCGAECTNIGLLGMWMTCNYGAVLTSYTLLPHAGTDGEESVPA